MDQKLAELQQKVRKTLAYTRSSIKRRANGALKYDYLVPAGPYEEQWDWDAFFMGAALASDISSEAIYLRNWALNLILNAQKDGKVPGCITAAGADPRLHHMKPFLGQGIAIASRHLNDYNWIKPYWSSVKKIVQYREKHMWDKKTNLGMWYDAMESGADNNVAEYRCESIKGMEKELGNDYDRLRKEKGGYVKEKVEDYPKASVVAVDVNVYLYREYKALSIIAKKLGKTKDAEEFAQKAKEIKKNIVKYLWNEEDGIFYSLDTTTGEHIKHITLTSFFPMLEKMATPEQAERMVKNYLWSTKHMLSKYGLRTLSKADTHYNNVNMLKPHSNWQGPVWPIANYIYFQCLLAYGYQEEAIELAKRISNLVIADIEETGGMHENYDAETGKGLAAPNFISWNVLVINMIEDAVQMKNPFALN